MRDMVKDLDLLGKAGLQQVEPSQLRFERRHH
jgi:hypothetical protein